MLGIPKLIKAFWNVPSGKKLPVSKSFLSVSSETDKTVMKMVEMSRKETPRKQEL